MMQPFGILVRSLLLVTLLPSRILTYEVFQTKIPNGSKVPNPCKPGQNWNGVGHILDKGSGTRNPFGRDFEAASYRWTEELCRKDSDGDGIYNGLELGDPDCVWTENVEPKNTDGITHPGICDPWDSMFCGSRTILSPKYSTQSAWLKDKCQGGAFDCPAMKDKDLRNVTAHLPVGTRVPAQFTTYFCQIYSIYELGVPPGIDYHMVAVTPAIDNKDMVHHIVLFGCTESAVATPEAFECGMKPAAACLEFMHVWTIGLAGECYHPDSGIRIGPTGYKFMAIQLHWTNVRESPDITDSSGLVLHYTPNLKKYDGGVFVLGSVLFYLPPNQEKVVVNSVCGSGCTDQLISGSINITAAWNHMHYAGKTMSIEVLRNNSHYTYLTMDKIYNYDSPQVMIFPTPVEIRPGDSIITRCGFSTKGRNRTISWGDATFDEMCFGFITFYPRQNMTFPYCLDKLGVSPCHKPSQGGCKNPGRFIKALSKQPVYLDVKENCMELTPCLQECADVIVKHMKEEPCLRGPIWEFIQDQMMTFPNGTTREFLSLLASCHYEVKTAMHAMETTLAVAQKPMIQEHSAGSTGAAFTIVPVLSSLAISLQIFLN